METQMALADFTSAPRTSLLESALRAVADWLAAMRETRRQEKVLNDLLFMPEHRLRDLGLDPQRIVTTIDERYWSMRK
jgi:uncharacterized protein YjiS (DUF1127 family)